MFGQLRHMVWNTTAHFVRRQYTYKPLYNLEVIPPNIVYQSLESILEYLQNNKTDESANTLLEIYHQWSSAKEPAPQLSNSTKKYPLIVLEGLDLAGKSTMTRILASEINAKAIRTPCVRLTCREKGNLRNACYALGNYLAGMRAQKVLNQRPVVMDRFWHATVAHALADAVQVQIADLPERGNPVYRWPTDLVKPDAVLLMAVSEKERMRRKSRRRRMTATEIELRRNHIFRQNLLLAYQYMEEPSVRVVNCDGNVAEALDRLKNSIQDVLEPLQEEEEKL